MVSNKQNIIGYLEALQVEYLISEIRRKIYPSPSDKRFYERVMLRKEDKIKDIATKNTLLSIFNSEIVRNEYIGKLYNVKGLPNFGKYQTKEDIINYYSINSIVKVYDSPNSDMYDFQTGTIIKYDNRKLFVTVYMSDNNTRIVSSGLVTRIM